MRRPHPALPVALLGALAVCWILLTPPGAGPDEPSHLVRAGALANGDRDEFLAHTLDPSPNAHQLPQEYSIPEPGCYAFSPTVGVDCAVGSDLRPVAPDGTVTLLTNADNYPIWGHVVPAAATALPGDGGIWIARGAGASVAVALVGLSVLLAAQRSATTAAAVLVAATPMTWATLATVNPSVFATAGAIALWTALMCRHPGWLLAAGWAALALPRRDGLIWACLIVGAVIVGEGRRPFAEMWRRRRHLAGPLVLVAASTSATLVWDVTNGSRVAQLGAAAPLIPVAAWGLRALWDRWDGDRARRAALAAAVTVAGVVGVAASFVVRPGGWDAALAEAVVRETRRHLTEAIGVLGWLDTPLPRWATLGWVVLVAVLVGAGVRARAWNALALAAGVLVLAVVTSWMFELQEGSGYGRYWQGRYSLPLLAGIPIVLGSRVHLPRRAALALSAAALFLLNVAAWAAARRWAVGIDGTMRPWNWGADLIAVHPLILLVAHAAVSLALLATCVSDRERAARDR